MVSRTYLFTFESVKILYSVLLFSSSFTKYKCLIWDVKLNQLRNTDLYPTCKKINIFFARAGLSRAFLQGAEIYGLCDI